MVQNFLGTIRPQIALGQAFQEAIDLRLRRKHLQSRDGFIFFRLGVQRLVGGSAHVIRRSNVQLPHVLRFPRGQRLRIHGFDVGVSQQAKHLQPLRSADLVAESLNSRGIVNIAAQCG